MRFVNSITLQLEEFVASRIPEYVILSHTWGEDEVSMQDMLGPSAKEMKGFAKIEKCCAQAARDGFKYAWIDTCCIDKSSSAELSEAINSMYEWYRNARICYAYLEDVTVPFDQPERVQYSEIQSSRWFTRGWTLQELIAPAVVEFYSKDWIDIGTKISRQIEVSSITGIDIRVLRGDKLSTCNVAQRMSWASTRITTRPEDMAYCLMGLFNVNMPLLYGEGGDRAFARLQEEIMRSAEDYTLFAWSAQESEPSWTHRGLLASSPQEFGNPNSHLRRLWKYSELLVSSPAEFGNSPRISGDPPVLTSMGLRISLPLKQMGSGDSEEYLACLYCRKGRNNELLCITLRKLSYRPLLYGRIMAHEVKFLTEDQMTFSYSTITVIHTSSDSAEWRPRWSHEYGKHVFKIKLVPDTGLDLSISNMYPLSADDVWDILEAGIFLDERYGSYKVMELLGPNSEPLFIGFGVLDGKNMPWCDIWNQAEFTVDEDWIYEGLYKFSHCRTDSADSSDRVTKFVPWRVTAVARPGPYINIKYQGRSLTLPGYTLTIYWKSEEPGSKSPSS